MSQQIQVVTLLAGMACLSQPALAQERVIGLLTLPEMFGRGPCDRFTPRPLVLRAMPDGRMVGTVLVVKPWTHHSNGGCAGLEVGVQAPRSATVQPLPTMEYAYEEPGAVVLERRGQWFRVRVDAGSAWLEASAQDEFYGLERLFEVGLTYLTQAWKGQVAASSAADDAQDFTKSTSFRCLAPRTEPCFTHRGRLSGQNGIPYMIWLVGTHRIVRIDQTEMPSMLSKYLSMTSPDHADVYGDFDICPLEADRPGHMRAACVTGAGRLVVQDRARSRPPRRLLSTWPKEQPK